VREVQLEERGSFEELLRDDERIVAYGIGPSGDALALVAEEDASGEAAVVSLRGLAERVEVTHTGGKSVRVQPLPEHEILVVATRANRNADGSHDLNGRVFGADGELRREFLLGDGIADVQTTADGQVWVSYFDEGIYGNLGWGGRDGPRPGSA
jgi:hypothetical protein